MKPIPDIDNVQAMTAWGRRSALMSAHKEAREALRDACTAAQGANPDEIGPAEASIAAANRLLEIAGLWSHT
jgi:hypothetical protein